jgi:DNA-binding NarL/FixJ family response regulator
MGAIAQPQGVQSARVLIIDDHPAAREGLAARLTQAGFEICGEAADVAGGLQLLATSEPDVVIVDVSLKRGCGIDLTQRIRGRSPGVRILVWSMYDETLYAERALRAGASGYVNKREATDTVVAAVRQVLGGGIYLSREMTETLVRQAAGNPARSVGADPISRLSDRELEVFRLIGLGLDTHQMADRMGLSPKTVETYRGRVKQKLGAGSSIEVVRMAVRMTLENG